MRKQHRELTHKLVLIGYASYGYDEVDFAIQRFNLDNEIIKPGWVKEGDMPYLYNGASAFVFPSRYEGFGIPLLQAMACGLPVAASYASSIPEVTGDAALLFDPDDIKAMTKAMHKLITDKELRQKLIEKGYQRVKDFSWEKCARETLAEIMKL